MIFQRLKQRFEGLTVVGILRLGRHLPDLEVISFGSPIQMVASVEKRQRRKLAVILHADIVSSTTLVQKDESLAHKRIQDSFRRFSEIIKAYGGLVHELRGDALVAEFDRSSDAVCAALAFQSETTRINAELQDDLRPELRVGISMGEVIIADQTVTGAGVVLAQRLEQLAEPGGVCIQGAAYETVPQRMPFTYQSLGEQVVKGFDAPVRAYTVSVSAGQVTPAPESRSTWKSKWLPAAAVGLFLMVAGWLAWFQPWVAREEPTSAERMAHPSTDKPSIAVLPFANMSGDPEQEYFSDGISEDIITDLSRLSNLLVIARNSSFTYKGSPVKVQQVGQDLGVRYVLEGSVRKAGDRVRITAQLVDTGSGHHLWAERYDRKLIDIFKLQDDITRRIVDALAIHLSEDEKRGLERAATSSFEAYDLFLRGQKISTQFTKEALDRAVEFYRQAIHLDPDYAHAYSGLGVARIRQFFFGYSDSPTRTKDRALELARKAASIDPTSHQVQWALGYILMYRRQFDEAERSAKRAVSLSTNYADGYALLALIKNNLGQAEEAIPLLKKAMVLNPYYTWDYVFQLGRAYYAMGEYTKAIPHLRDAIERNPAVGMPRLFLAATYVNLGSKEDAEWEITELQMSHPEYTLSHVKKTYPIVNQKLMDRFLSDVRMAGLAE